MFLVTAAADGSSCLSSSFSAAAEITADAITAADAMTITAAAAADNFS